MKRTIPILITMLAGIVLIVSNFIPAAASWGEAAAIWFDILAGIAFLLGGANLVRVHLKKVSDKHAGWGYSLIILGTFFLTLGFGMTKTGVKPAANSEFYGETFAHVPADKLPPEMIFKVAGVFPERLKNMNAEELYYAIPASCREQFSITKENEFIFKGWMLETQMGDLLAVSELIDWKAAIEALHELAQPPGELQGKVIYRFEHEAVAIIGVLSSENEKKLVELGSTPEWKESITKGIKETEKNRDFILDYKLDQVKIPEKLKDRVVLTDNKMTVKGPLEEEDYIKLAGQFPVIRSITPLELEVLEKELNHYKQLSEKQTEVLRNKLNSYNWTAADLIAAINAVGKPLPGTKTYREIKAEKDKGVTDFDLIIPATGDPVILNQEQEAVIQKYATDATMRIDALLDELKAAGNIKAGQLAEVKRFLSQIPTRGKRNREVCLALYGMSGESITNDQVRLLMGAYKKELAWSKQMYDVFMTTNPPKYNWSGEFDKEGSVYHWIYENMFSPLQATVFAMLAFYVASAAFRAFRAKNMEAILLLGTAFLILLGRTFAGDMLSNMVPEKLFFLKIQTITDWIMQVPYTAGGRAVMIGIALGVISTSLKVLLGIDRSFLGGDD